MTKSHHEMLRTQSIVIAAGGTGGHVFPGLAVARLLKKEGYCVHWMGTLAGLEVEQVPKAGFIFHPISVRGLRGKGWVRRLTGFYQLVLATWQSVCLLRKIQPIGVLGLGGFVAGPVGFASWILNIPLVIHEQNAVAGMTNRLLAFFARRILTAFPAAFKRPAWLKKVQLLGNPLREEILNTALPEQRWLSHEGALRLLIVGGSLGAQVLNEVLPKAVAQLPLEQRPTIIHQTGKNHWQTTEALYAQQGVSAQVKPFLADMAEVYAWADLVICRAGALTVSELAAVGVGAVLIPFPLAVDDHQTKNADFLVAAGAACMIPQRDLTPSLLAQCLSGALSQRAYLLTMAQAARKLARLHATDEVTAAFLEVCCDKK